MHMLVCSVWSRPLQCEDDREIVFHRTAVAGRCPIKTNGIESDMSYSKLARAAKVLQQPHERAILVQTKQHYADLRAQFSTSLEQHFTGETAEFGENLIVDGVDATSVCVADVFRSDQSSLVLQVSSPRLACARPDKLHRLGLTSGQPGTVRQWVAANGRAGFFCRVLHEGDVAIGDSFQLVRRTQPAWSLSRLSSLCYPTTPLKVTWAGTAAELQSLCKMDELALFEWKERLLPLCSQNSRQEHTMARADVSPEAMSGDGTLANVGIKLDGGYACRHCHQRFCSDRALDMHCKFIHTSELQLEH
eukprot:TRINITY_DN24411_c0_g1_i1.p1 TRINITY_DN24411_c0_g1~~TRINITY_DN24411_c0_g1_i1.p1  ORF type:complete len:305 (-),score=28.95 TRINITY_DN24411_c0_g1_i1:216-1130(-)